MSDLFIALNGVGHGHLMRSLIFANWLEDSGSKPLVALQGLSKAKAGKNIPVANIPLLYSINSNSAQKVASTLEQVASLTYPIRIFEDTFPAPVNWPDWVEHYLVVQPWSFPYMRLLRYKHGNSTFKFLVCDEPGSPTWPYNRDETDELLEWTGWECIGPVYRAVKYDVIPLLKRKYKIDENCKIYVFSMGGGGNQKASNDYEFFIEKAINIAKGIRTYQRNSRFLFVKGTLFPSRKPIPEIFEPIQHEPELPSLISISDGAVIRPGFNVMWECLASCIPFTAIPGTTYLEPVKERLAALTSRGLDISDNIDKFISSDKNKVFKVICEEITKNTSLSKSKRKFLSSTKNTRLGPTKKPDFKPLETFICEHFSHLLNELSIVAKGSRLLLRLDDVVKKDTALIRLVELCYEYDLYASIEVIPYLLELSPKELEKLDPERRIEVSQHGFAHLPDYLPDLSNYGEFLLKGPSKTVLAQLESGKKNLEQIFGSRFKGGFSCPFDKMPNWLPYVWNQIGGQYLSWIHQGPFDTDIDNVRLQIDIWDWTNNRVCTREKLAELCIHEAKNAGHVGIVLHGNVMESQASENILRSLITCLIKAGLTSIPISQAVKTKEISKNNITFVTN